MKLEKIFLILLFFILNRGFVVDAQLVKNESDFDKRYSELWPGESIVIFPFYARAISSEGIDYVTVTDRIKEIFENSFRNRTSLKVINEKVKLKDDSITVSTIRDAGGINPQVPDINSRETKENKEILLTPVRNLTFHLSGTLDSFVKGRTFEESYVKITLRLVDGVSKVVYWVTTIEGCLKYVANSVADSVSKGYFIGPSEEEERISDWKDPRLLLPSELAWGLSAGSFTPLGILRRSIEDNLNISADFYFFVHYIKPVRNRISLSLIDRVKSKLADGSSYDFVPVTLSFFYDLPWIKIKRVPDWKVYGRGDLGLTFSWLSFPGLEYEKQGKLDLLMFGGLGFGTEYSFDKIVYFKSPLFFYLPRSGLFIDVMFYLTGFRNSDFTLTARPVFSFTGGFKIYL